MFKRVVVALTFLCLTSQNARAVTAPCIEALFNQSGHRLTLYARQLAPKDGTPLDTGYHQIEVGGAVYLHIDEPAMVAQLQQGPSLSAKKSGIHQMLSAARIVHVARPFIRTFDPNLLGEIIDQSHGFLPTDTLISQVEMGMNSVRGSVIDTSTVLLTQEQEWTIKVLAKFTHERTCAWDGEMAMLSGREVAPICSAPPVEFSFRNSFRELMRTATTRVPAVPFTYSNALALADHLFEFAEDQRVFALKQIMDVRFPAAGIELTHDEMISVLLALPTKDQQRGVSVLLPHVYTHLYMYDLLKLDTELEKLSTEAQRAIISQFGELPARRIQYYLAGEQRDELNTWIKRRGSMWPRVVSTWQELL